MAFIFNSEEERVAIEGTDELTHPYMKTYSEARWYDHENSPATLCQGEMPVTESHYKQQPEMRPLTLDGLRVSHNDLTTFQGFWSILWSSETRYRTDVVYDDKFRSVVVFGKVDIEVALRPVRDDARLGRIFLGPGDVQDILNKAQQVVVYATNQNPAQEIAAVIGRGTVMHPRDKPEDPEDPLIPFEWKVARAHESRLINRIRLWRYAVCGGSSTYRKRESEYKAHLRYFGYDDPREGQRASFITTRKKRSSGAGEEGGTGLKRRSYGSSQRGTSPQPSVSSPEISRPASVADPGQPTVDPPPPVGPGQPGRSLEHPIRHGQSRRGASGLRGSICSSTSRVGSRMASLTFQLPTGGSLESVTPPPEGSPSGEPQAVASRVPGQFSGEYEPQVPMHGQRGQGFPPQIPGHEYQGPGPAQQDPSPGDLVEVYGYLQPADLSLLRRPPQVGIEHTQHFAAHGGWDPQRPGQQQVPVATPEQHSYQRDHAGFVDAQSGSGCAGGSGHNLNVPVSGDSNVQGGRYPSGFPPMQPAMHGGHFSLSHQTQHMAAVSSEGGHDPSILQSIPPDASPQPDFPSGTQPMYQHPDMQPLPPPAMSNMDPAQLQAQTTLQSVEQNYPSSLQPAAQPMPAVLNYSPEQEDFPADLESDEEDNPVDSEPDGEDDQFSYPGTPVTLSLPDIGGQDNGQTNASPMARYQSFYEDVFMGADAFDDDDNFHRG